MTEENTAVKITHGFKLEKRNDDGELFEVVEFKAGEQGKVVDAKATFRRRGLAPDEAYASEIPAPPESGNGR